MLTRWRSKFVGLLEITAAPLSLLEPSIVTVLSAVAAFSAFLSAYFLRNMAIPLILVLLSGYFDWVDGFIARRQGKASRKGAFLDSTLDRVSDAFYVASLSSLGLLTWEEAFFLAVGTITISYMRARGEGLGVKVEGTGLAERAERIVLILAALAVGMFNILAARILLIFLGTMVAITLVQRFLLIYRTVR